MRFTIIAKVLKFLLLFFLQPVPLISHTCRNSPISCLGSSCQLTSLSAQLRPTLSHSHHPRLERNAIGSRLAAPTAYWVVRHTTLGTRCSSIGFDCRSYSSCLVCVVATVWATFNFSFHFSSWSASHVNGCKITELNKFPECKSQSEAKYETKSSRVESSREHTTSDRF